MTDVNKHDLDVLRRLAERKARIASDPKNLERKRLWLKHDQNAPERPVVLIEVEGVRDKNPPLPDAMLECENDFCRSLERTLRTELYLFDVIRDDHVIEPYVNFPWKIDISDYGVEVVKHHAEAEGVALGAVNWDAPIKDLDRDLSLLKPRTFSVDREYTLQQKALLEKIFKDVLPVRIRGQYYWTMGLTNTAIQLIGLENLMLYMYDQPAGLHRLMKFLRDDHLAFTGWLEAEGLYTLNNENDYIGSGSMGYTQTLPQSGWRAGDKVRRKDLWVLSESQETVGVGPELFEEFIFPYQLDITRNFGSLYYGCCESVHTRISILKKAENLKRVSVAPWSDEEIMARELGREIVYSRKPNPTLISTEDIKEDLIRKDLRKTLSLARDCNLEIVMKDVHTLKDQPERVARWVEIAFDEINRMF